MAKSKVEFPDGTVVEIANDTPPEQITAIIQALRGTMTTPVNQAKQETGKIIEPKLSAEEMWETGSKKDRLALFIRNHFLPEQWFSTIEVRDQQLEFVKRLIFGESPAIATYLNRLHKDGYLNKAKQGSNVRYQLTTKIMDEYHELQLHQMAALLEHDI